MKENQTESCQKCLLIKIQESHRKALGTDLIKKRLTWGVKNRCVRGH